MRKPHGCVVVKVNLPKNTAERAQDIRDYFGVPLPKLMYADVLASFERIYGTIPQDALTRIRKDRKTGN